MESLHSHCLKCVNRRCMIRPETGVSCDLIGCPLVCGAVFHACKVEEHRLLCPYERVPCLNSGFGCPFSVARIKMAEHLETCPASVVCCTMEWNRWPVSYADRKSYENLSKDFDDVEQLDMALALQDQRMLLESLKVTTTVSKNGEKQMEESEKMAAASGVAETQLSNGTVDMEQEPYNDLYAASVETSRSLVAALDILTNSKDVDVFVGNVNGENPKNRALHSGENGDFAAEDVKNVDMKESDSDSDCELGAVGGVDSDVGIDGEEDDITWVEQSDFVELFVEPEKDNVICDQIDDSSLVRPEMPYHSMPVVVPVPPEPQPVPLSPPMPFLLPDQLRNNLLQHLPIELGYRCLERKLQNVDFLRGMSVFTFNGRRALLSDPYLFRAKMEDKAVDTSDLEVADDPMGLHGIDLITAALLFCLGDSPGGRGISDSRFVDGYHIDFGTQTFSFPSAILATNTMVGDIASASACDHASPQLSNPSPFHTLRLDLVLECVARYQTKQRSMFTFVCGQLFRRDEFSSHFKNVHGDIHAGLNGWMEHRCPLAYYGCTYSQRRFCPSVQGSRIIHDRHLGSFGVQLGLPCKNEDILSKNTCSFDTKCDHVSSLPFEVLQHVASFLDGFSLCQLSRVSRTMRDVCASLLQMRGMVVLLWEKKKLADGSTSWQITDKVWRFSTAFGTVNEWKFANIASMADHLKKCQFNTIARREEAVPLPCMCFTRELTKEGRCLRSVLKPVA
ncbi:F-box only protein 30-like [Lampris incognitus]|uniref:F-box only protein 30-like n=1 Tax=Lampris incognitus TaxID=2546036 RepID=UPI0024B4EA0D|nr:F-box only protein 30-like [Lampris incognitus]XP_056151982.1 F-box only protein 30-like [Lampris incognitus]XP_056151983.1 F-box only protein 30-like [Lampris incognitus]XP_056151984.1 F-box only protein 30-like [Lampris incognitus]